MELNDKQKKFAKDMALVWIGSEQMYEELAYDLGADGLDLDDEALYVAVVTEIERLHGVAAEAVRADGVDSCCGKC